MIPVTFEGARAAAAA